LEIRPWGLVGANVSAAEARELGRATTDGVRVLSVRPGGAVEQAKPAIGREDIIVEIDGVPVRSIEDLRARTATMLGRGERASLLVAFERGLERRLTVVEVTTRAAPADEGAEATKAWVPVAVQVLTPVLAKRLGLDGKTGVRVTRVIESSSPLAVGDIILAIDGEPVRASSPNDEDVFAAMIRRARIGSTVTLAVDRNGRAMQLPITLRATPKPSREMATFESADFEFKVRDLVETDAADPRLRGVSRGVLVESVSQGGWAALGRLAVNDIILQVDGHAVGSVADLSGRVQEIVAAKRRSVVLQIRRGIRTLFLELRPEWR
jgi:serine protease Do